MFFESHEFGAFGSSLGPGMHIGPSFVGATGIMAQVELGGLVPSLTCTHAPSVSRLYELH